MTAGYFNLDTNKNFPTVETPTLVKAPKPEPEAALKMLICKKTDGLNVQTSCEETRVKCARCFPKPSTPPGLEP